MQRLVFLLLLALIPFLPLAAHDGPGSRFGPERDLPLDRQEAVRIRVPAGTEVVFSFSFRGRWEQAVTVHDGFWRTLAERGNFARSSEPLVLPPAPQERLVYVAGWHRGGQAGELGWRQSRRKKVHYPPAGTIRVSYEDGAEHGYNEAEVFITLRRASEEEGRLVAMAGR